MVSARLRVLVSFRPTQFVSLALSFFRFSQEFLRVARLRVVGQLLF
jgi:hypothetical protein